MFIKPKFHFLPRVKEIVDGHPYPDMARIILTNQAATGLIVRSPAIMKEVNSNVVLDSDFTDLALESCDGLSFVNCKFGRLDIEFSQKILFLDCTISRIYIHASPVIRVINSKILAPPLRETLSFIANLSGTTISNTTGTIHSQREWLEQNCERTDEGFIVYKKFNSVYASPSHWKIKAGEVIQETLDFDRSNACSYGINVATADWYSSSESVWKCLLRYEDSADVCVPYETDGDFRVGKLTILKLLPVGYKAEYTAYVPRDNDEIPF